MLNLKKYSGHLRFIEGFKNSHGNRMKTGRFDSIKDIKSRDTEWKVSEEVSWNGSLLPILGISSPDFNDSSFAREYPSTISQVKVYPAKF